MIPRYEQIHTYRCLWRHPDGGRDDIIAFQNRKLRRLIDRVHADVPYFRRLFDEAGLKPSDVQTVEDISKIPITTRQALRDARPEDTLARWADPKRLVSHRTSGSSGQPLTTRHTFVEENLINSFRVRAQRQFGVRRSDRIAAVGEGHQGEERYKLLAKIRQRIGNYRIFGVNCLLPTEEIVAELERLNPDVVTGYAGALAHIAPAVAARRSPRIKPRLMMAGAETLIPPMRRLIEKAFGARVFDLYGSHEFNILAWECTETGQYHICDDNIILEVLDEEDRPVGEGEQGEVVATSLHAFSMPFIRYRLGDLVIKGSETCPCGQPFSTLRSIQGRKMDYFYLPAGRCVHPVEITGPINAREADWVGQYQMTQEAIDRVVLRVMTLRKPEEKELAGLEQFARKMLGSDVDFRIELVEDFDYEPSGKFRVFRSMVRSVYDGT